MGTEKYFHFSQPKHTLWVLKTYRLNETGDGSFEHLKHMLKLMSKETNAFLGAQTVLIWNYERAWHNGSKSTLSYRASDLYQDWWAEVTMEQKMVGHFLK